MENRPPALENVDLQDRPDTLVIQSEHTNMDVEIAGGGIMQSGVSGSKVASSLMPSSNEEDDAMSGVEDRLEEINKTLSSPKKPSVEKVTENNSESQIQKISSIREGFYADVKEVVQSIKEKYTPKDLTVQGLAESGASKVDSFGNFAGVGAAGLLGADPMLAALVGGGIKLGTKGISSAIRKVGKGAGRVDDTESEGLSVFGKKIDYNENTRAARLERESSTDNPRAAVIQQMKDNTKTKGVRQASLERDKGFIEKIVKIASSVVGSGGKEEETGVELVKVNKENEATLKTTSEKITSVGDKLENMHTNFERVGEIEKDQLKLNQEKVQKLGQLEEHMDKSDNTDNQKLVEQERQQNAMLSEQKQTNKALRELGKGEGEEKSLFGRIIDTITGFFMGSAGLLATFKTGVMGFFAKAVAFIPMMLKGALKAVPLVGLIVGFVKGIFDGLMSGFEAFKSGEGIFKSLFTFVESFADSILRFFTFGLVNIEKLREWTQPLFDTIFGAVEAILGTIKSVVTKPFELIGAYFSWLTDFYVSGFEMVKEKVTSFFDVFADMFDKIKSVIPQAMSNLPFVGKYFGGSNDEGEESKVTSDDIKMGVARTVVRVIPKPVIWGLKKVPAIKRFFEGTNDEAPPEVAEASSTRQMVDPHSVGPGYSNYHDSHNRLAASMGRIELDTSEKEIQANNFSQRNLNNAAAPVRMQREQAARMQANMSSMAVMNTNHNSSQHVHIGRDVRKQDYLAGSMNRELDY